MVQVYVMFKNVNGNKRYLRYGLNGGGSVGYCMNRGEIVCFNSRDKAELVRSGFVNPNDWNLECYVRFPIH